ncbi:MULTISPECIES: recombinase family protein [Bacillus cereus group]|uniref:Site-specific recombinase n=1 Tax=Bacillus cereus (strain AH187) TaxID=405534 RepID=B7HU85_BACC7|nr:MULTISPECIES: recombinase family protein [Bacillus cereus group]ACJ80179.1 site-specific recombinase [Bacillus cereus AH187]MBR9742278.1 recombinase [Bacillus paranthracis]MDX5778768.1 recombinase family protein [Bacillus cereus group sp. DSM 4312]QGG21286.1 recombinase family protein [Bacillus paranthracis]
MYRPESLDVCIYLRKSRKDVEEERRAIEEGSSYNALERHRKRLFAIAKAENHNIIDIFEEVASGESIQERPQMQQLLRKLEGNEIDGVLVIDLDRLGRGDMLDAGMIDRAFRYSSTKIITPTDVYDPDDESWELVFGIKSLISRQELKSITKRLQNGRIDSVKEGKHIGKKPPYGYLKDENLRLYPDPEKAWIVKKIFELMCDGKGRQMIAAELDRLGIDPPVTKRGAWDSSTITSIIKNEVYTGVIVWGKFKHKKRNGKYTRHKNPQEKWIMYENAHEPIISKELFDAANEAHSSRHKPAVITSKKLTNPLAGILKCKLCGYTMLIQTRKDRPHNYLRCNNPACKGKQKQSVFNLVEEKLLYSLQQIVDEYQAQKVEEVEIDDSKLISFKEKAIISKEKELKELQAQKGNLHDLLEQGIYTVEIFLERQKNLVERITSIENDIEVLQKEIETEQIKEHNKTEFIPALKTVIESYHKTTNIELKNQLLKTILSTVTYYRHPDWKTNEFEIQVYFKI